MGAASENATLVGLMRLQQIDDEVLRIQRRLKDGPALVARCGEKFKVAEERLKEAHARVQAVRARVAEFELELKVKEADIEKASRQQLEAKSNQEYKALGDHIERLRGHCSVIEDRILEGFGAIEAAEGEERDLKQQLEELRLEKEKLEKQWVHDEQEYARELQAIQKRREEQCTALAQGALMVYERVLRARDGEAVVAVEGRVCGGCQMTITPNDLARLHSSKELITCKSCERILFLRDVHGAVAT